jgi:hypothetical protein
MKTLVVSLLEQPGLERVVGQLAEARTTKAIEKAIKECLARL